MSLLIMYHFFFRQFRMCDVTDTIVNPLFFLNMEDEQAKDNPMDESEQIRNFIHKQSPQNL